MVRNASRHRRGDSQALVNACEVVVHVVERNCRFVVSPASLRFTRGGAAVAEAGAGEGVKGGKVCKYGGIRTGDSAVALVQL